MSALAKKLPPPVEFPPTGNLKGPVGACAAYPPGDKEDWLAVNSLRRENDWAHAYRTVHAQLGIATGVPDGDKFRYHWRGKCRCWTPELKAWIDEQMAPVQS